MSRTPTRRDGPGGRFYTIDGQEYPSVTSILSAISKPALVGWSAKVEREAVTQAAADLYMQWSVDVSRKALPRSWYLTTLQAQLGQVRAHQTVLTAAGDLGTEIHQAIEWRMRVGVGAVAGPEPVLRPAAVIAVRAFDAWAASVSLKPLLIEKTIHSATHGYAGTMDLLARVNGEICLVDFKSGARIYSEAFLQSVAYNVALQELGYLAPTRAVIVRLPKTEADAGFEVQPVPPVADLFPVFLGAKAIWTWQQGNDRAYRRRTKVA